MFTGIVTDTHRVAGWQPVAGARRLRLERSPLTTTRGDGKAGGHEGLEIGESICVSGVCLSLVEATPETLGFDVIPETLRASAMGDRRAGDRVNVERALRAGDRLGGHLVQGHVDAIGRLRERHNSAEETILDIGIESGDGFRVIAKGCVTLNGVSLTVVEAAPDRFTVALIPHTLAVTDLGDLTVGARVNLEMDPIGKWITTLVADSPWGQPGEAPGAR